MELYQYEAPIIVGRKRKKRIVRRRTKAEVMAEVKSNEDSEFQMEIMRDYSLRRTRSRITRLINANADMRTFITLTFKDNVVDLFEANYIFNKFTKRLKRQFPQLKYLAVPEFQKRGAVHYHVLINVDYIENAKLAEIWGQGFVMINKVQHINNLGLYISKYICKDLFDIRYFGMRKILCSKNLEQPTILTVIKEIVKFLKTIKVKLIFEKNYPSDWLGRINYSLFSLTG